MNSKATLEHSPLDLTTKSVRLIKILPGDDDIVKCTMSVRVLRGGTYKAVSYVWGTDEPTCKIEINNRPFFIRSNLHTFLKHARRLCPDENFWIDAVCIDQDNLLEKNHQVRQMVDIYKLAEIVITWLGQESLHLQSFLESIPTINDPPVSKHVQGLSPLDLLQFEENISSICQLQYWSRLWIVPEILKAGKLLIMSGFITIPWLQMVEFVRQMCSVIGDPLSFSIQQSARSSRLASFAVSWDSSNYFSHHDLAVLLRQYGTNQCHDPPDRVFALLPLATDCYVLNLEVDYELNGAQVFCALLRKQRSVRLAELLLDALDLRMCDKHASSSSTLEWRHRMQLLRTLDAPHDDTAMKAPKFLYLYKRDVRMCQNVECREMLWYLLTECIPDKCSDRAKLVTYLREFHEFLTTDSRSPSFPLALFDEEIWESFQHRIIDHDVAIKGWSAVFKSFLSERAYC